MDAEKYRRSVSMLCPTCGCTQFSQPGENAPDTELVTCATCGRELTKAELIRENTENINEHVREVGKQIVKAFGDELRKSLKLR